jgi:putative transposase
MRKTCRFRTRAYLVTLWAWSRGSLFGRVTNGKMRRNPVGREVAACWNRLPRQFGNVALDSFVVMPDRLHGIVLVTDQGAQPSKPLAEVLDFFKLVSARRVDCGIWRGGARGHVLRGEEELTRARHYIREYPSRLRQLQA